MERILKRSNFVETSVFAALSALSGVIYVNICLFFLVDNYSLSENLGSSFDILIALSSALTGFAIYFVGGVHRTRRRWIKAAAIGTLVPLAAAVAFWGLAMTASVVANGVSEIGVDGGAIVGFLVIALISAIVAAPVIPFSVGLTFAYLKICDDDETRGQIAINGGCAQARPPAHHQLSGD